MTNLTLNQDVYFKGEIIPMNIMALSENFAVCFREQNGLPYFLVLDFKNNISNKEAYIFKRIDGDNQKYCDILMKELEEGKCEINKQNSKPINIDWNATSKG